VNNTAALSINDLTFRYPASPPVAAWTLDVNRLVLARSEQMLLTAVSGQGKSTLLHLVAGLLDPDKGRVEVAGTHVHGLRGAARDRFRGRSIGMVFQTFNLLHGFTALENVLAALMFSDVPRRDHARRARQLLNTLGLDQIDGDVDRMSVGQQQRVAVARAVACHPVLVLADEPTASLDPTSGAAAMDLIQSVCREQGAALLCVSHDPTLASRFERRESLTSLAGAPTCA
jgi:putative ABC transport system ATP-binding protein